MQNLERLKELARLPINKFQTRLADVTYYKGMLYTVGWGGDVVAFDIHAFITSRAHHDHDLKPIPKPKPKLVALPPLNCYGGFTKYIVESSGNLLQVQRFYNSRFYNRDMIRKTIKFQVFKLLLKNEGQGDEEEKCKWEEVKSLQGHSLFLGDNGSMSLSAAGCKPNCIYFTDDCLFGPPGADGDYGVFNLEDGGVEQHSTIKPDSSSIWPPPIWVQPTLVRQRQSKL